MGATLFWVVVVVVANDAVDDFGVGTDCVWPSLLRLALLEGGGNGVWSVVVVTEGLIYSDMPVLETAEPVNVVFTPLISSVLKITPIGADVVEEMGEEIMDSQEDEGLEGVLLSLWSSRN